MYPDGVQTGDTLGPYQILGLLGAGGMGAVYRARDTRLERDVALKVILPGSNSDPLSRRRLLNEAKAASALNHPHVVTVYEAASAGDTDYIAMEYIAGETLAHRIARGPVPLAEALNLCLQVGEGLVAAHGAGFLHRDLKPANIMITPDGRAKILDFGLARRIISAPVVAMETVSIGLTMPGVVMGTLAYMSPEQARGEEPGPASDVFSWGAVLYETLCGDRPFGGKTELDLYHQVCYKEPVPPAERRRDVPAAVSALTMRALAKEPADRFPNMSSAIAELRALAAGDTGKIPARGERTARGRLWPALAAVAACGILAAGLWLWLRPKPFDSVAILPFVNATGDPSLDYVVEGLSDGLRRDLTRLNGLSVTSADAVRGYRQPDLSALDAAGQLRVSAVMGGKLTVSGADLQLSVTLTGAARGDSVWTQSYDVPRTDIVRLSDRLWIDSADQLGRKLGASRNRHTPAPQAYDLYLKGRAALSQRDPAELRRAISLFEEATREDPDFGPAFASLAATYFAIANFGEQPPVLLMPRARDAAKHAIDLDPTLAEAYLSYAMILSVSNFDWAAAEKAFRRAIDLNPRSAQAHASFATLGLVPTKRFDEALIEVQRAVELEPNSPVLRIQQATVMYMARHFAESVRVLRQVVNPGLQGPVRSTEAYALVAEGKPDDAVALLSSSGVQEGKMSTELALGFAYAAAGRRAEAAKIARAAEVRYGQAYSSPCSLAVIYVRTGEFDRAIHWLEECRTQGDFSLVVLGVDAAWDPLRTDPRLRSIMKSMGLT